MRLGRALTTLALVVVPSVAHAQEPPPPLPVPTPTPTAPQTAPPIVVMPATAASTVLVKIDSPEPVDLEVQIHGAWQVVCHSPCNAALSTKENYRINGDGVRASNGFRLEPGTSTTVAVDPASSTGHVLAIVITVVGGVGLVPAIGVTALLVLGELFGLILICPLAQLDPKTTYGSCLVDIGGALGQYYGRPYVWIPLVAGLLMVSGGGAWLASSGPTTAKQTPTGAPPTAPGKELPITRAPEWMTPPAYPAAVTSPWLVVNF